MKYHELKTAPTKNAKRVGRGIAAGQGKTAGRGTKGQKSRTGSSRRPGFEGGQNPLMQRLPKLRGFRTHHVAAETVYVGQLNELGAGIVDAAKLAEAGLVSNPYVSIKLLVGRGELAQKANVKLPAASAAALAAIEKAGGSFQETARLARPATREHGNQHRKGKQ